MDASTLTLPRLVPRSPRLLAALSDERLAAHAKQGNAAAFEVIYDRHHRGLLSLCRQILRSQEDAEDALQQTFASAFRALPRNDQPAQLKPWLYRIARNRCLDMLRARREYPSEELDTIPTAGLSQEVERRAELRELLSDLEDLPEEQRSALVLSEVGDLAHAEIAQVLECEPRKVKSLVFQAREALIEDRRARALPCADIREQLATATAGDLRRGHLRRHVRKCSGCAEFRDDVRRQRQMLALALPVVPSLGLKESALAVAGIGGGGAAGGGGLIAALGAHGAAKVAAVAIATGGTVGGVAATDPSLVDKAQAAVERVAHEVGSVVSGSSADSGREDLGTGKGGGSFDWKSAEDAARQQTRRDQRSGRGPFSEGEHPAGGARGQGRGRGRGEDARAANPGRGRSYGQGEGPPRAGAGRGQGEQGPRNQGRPSGSSSGGSGSDRGRDSLNVPDARGGDGRVTLPRPGELLERGADRARGLGLGD